MVLALGIPYLVIWIIGFPLVIFYLLRRNRTKLDEREIIMEYGFFYIGLTDKSYYWEILIVNARKMLISVITASL
jgi:hypothetical protein